MGRGPGRPVSGRGAAANGCSRCEAAGGHAAGHGRPETPSGGGRPAGNAVGCGVVGPERRRPRASPADGHRAAAESPSPFRRALVVQARRPRLDSGPRPPQVRGRDAAMRSESAGDSGPGPAAGDAKASRARTEMSRSAAPCPRRPRGPPSRAVRDTPGEPTLTGPRDPRRRAPSRIVRTASRARCAGLHPSLSRRPRPSPARVQALGLKRRIGAN
jgi:hypothetical protein